MVGAGENHSTPLTSTGQEHQNDPGNNAED
jgi:hypothetical protein